MAIGSVGNAINAYTNAARITGNNAPQTAGTESFGKMLQDATTSTLGTLKQGEAASLQAVTGNADLASVTQAVTDAQVALQTVVAVRDLGLSRHHQDADLRQRRNHEFRRRPQPRARRGHRCPEARRTLDVARARR